nr:hypothetical protein BaRGS_013989 [Batillaria attramentaria]
MHDVFASNQKIADTDNAELTRVLNYPTVVRVPFGHYKGHFPRPPRFLQSGQAIIDSIWHEDFDDINEVMFQ